MAAICAAGGSVLLLQNPLQRQRAPAFDCCGGSSSSSSCSCSCSCSSSSFQRGQQQQQSNPNGFQFFSGGGRRRRDDKQKLIKGTLLHIEHSHSHSGFSSLCHASSALRARHKSSSYVLSRSYSSIGRTKICCARETESEKSAASGVVDPENKANDDGTGLQSGGLLLTSEDQSPSDSSSPSHKNNSPLFKGRSSGGNNATEQLSTFDEKLDDVILGAAEKVAEVGHSSIGAVAERVEVAAEVAASFGDTLIESPLINDNYPPNKAEALKRVAFWFSSAVAFGVFLAFKEGSGKASEFFAGYILEQSLSVDNLVVFVLIFKYFQVPLPLQNRVLTYGIIGAVVFRALMIGLGIASIQRFEGLNLIFAAILIFSSYKLVIGGDDEEGDLSNNYIVTLCKRFIPVTDFYDGDKFTTVVDGVRKATPLLLTLLVVELSDIAFAVDSIPAVFGVTRDPLIVYTSNIFAILGLRSLYTLISGNMSDLAYLQPAVGLVLGFIGTKMIADFLGFHVPTEYSLGVVALVLGGGVILSLLERSKKDRKE